MKFNNNPEINHYLLVFNFVHMNRLQILKNYIINSPFVNARVTLQLCKIFCKTQKVYRALTKFIYIYKFFKASTFNNSRDLQYNSFKHCPDSQKIIILHHNKKYLFRLSELVRIWKNSLSQSEEFFPEPKTLRNPYTNIPFNNANLYNIYFRIRQNSLFVPILIQGLFELEFDITKFKIKFNNILKNIAIKNYINDGDVDDIILDIKNMCREYYSGSNILRFKTKDNELKIIKQMKPYIHLYYFIEYSSNAKIKNKSKAILKKEFTEFWKVNYLGLNSTLFSQKCIIPNKNFWNAKAFCFI